MLVTQILLFYGKLLFPLIYYHYENQRFFLLEITANFQIFLLPIEIIDAVLYIFVTNKRV